MAGSLSEAGKALLFSVSTKPGGEISINISTDNVEVAIQALKVVGITATTLGALYFGYDLMRSRIKAAVDKALGGERDDQGDPDIKPGSLRVRLHCFTDKRFLEVLADYDSGRMGERLKEELSQVGIKVEGLKVEIENIEEVNKTKEAINKRSNVNKDLFEDIKNITIDDPKSDMKKIVEQVKNIQEYIRCLQNFLRNSVYIIWDPLSRA